MYSSNYYKICIININHYLFIEKLIATLQYFGKIKQLFWVINKRRKLKESFTAFAKCFLLMAFLHTIWFHDIQNTNVLCKCLVLI